MADVEKLKEELVHILNQVAKEQSIENYEVTPNTERILGDGFVAHFYTGSVQNKDTGENIAVAIKKAPAAGAVNFNSMFINEDLFYSVIFPALDALQKETNVSIPFNNVPKYFCGNTDAKNDYIAMENLKPLGYVMFDKKQYLGKDHLEKIFRTYGKLHALSYVLRKKNEEKYQDISKGLSHKTSEFAKFVKKPMTDAISAGVNALDSENDKILLEELQDFGENVMETLVEVSAYKGELRCLVHGDCWSNNMLFKYSESGELLDIKLVDFQLCRDNSPIHDLSYFFYSGASKKDFDELDSYLEIYYQSFLDFAKQLGADSEEIFSFEELKSEWKGSALFGVIMSIYLWQVKLIPKETFADNASTVEKEKPSMEERFKRLDIIMKSVHKTDLYKERTTAILRHAYAYGVLNRNKIVRNK